MTAKQRATTRSSGDQLEWELNCYGIRAEQIHKSIQDFHARAPGMAAMSRLSDAQELITQDGGQESARQLINQAKMIIAEYLSEE